MNRSSPGKGSSLSKSVIKAASLGASHGQREGCHAKSLGLRTQLRGSWGVTVFPPAQFPFLSVQCQGKAFSSIHLWTRLLSALAGLLYASAIVAHDRRPEYLLRATPWFLTSLGRAALDLSVSTWGLGGLTAHVSSPPCPCGTLFPFC